MMYEIRLYFSYENIEQLDDILDYLGTTFESFTIFQAIGYYKGISEQSTIFELITDNSVFTRAKMENTINYIKICAHQECVLYTIKEIKVEFK